MVTGKDANLTVDGISLTSASNTVADMIPGITIQLLSPSATESDGSLEQVQVVIANYNTSVVSSFETLVSDYNALVSAVSAQEGNTSSGTAEPLFGSPTLSLLQQQLMSGINATNPNGYLTAVTDNTNPTLSGSMVITLGNGMTDTVVIGAGTNTASTIYTGSSSGYNTLSGLASAINAAISSTTLSYTDAGTTGTTTPDSGTLTANSTAGLSGSIAITVGSGTTETIVIGAEPSSGAAANTIYTGSGVNTLSGLASTINADTSLGFTAAVVTTDGVATLTLTSGTNDSSGALTVTPSLVAAGLGVAANVVTSNGSSTLTLTSAIAGSRGALTVNSTVEATSDTALSASITAGTAASGSTSATASTATLSTISSGSDVLSGSISIQVGNNAAQTITIGTSSNTLTTLAAAITNAGAGVTASVVYDSNGAHLLLTSGTTGTGADLTVTSNILDTNEINTAKLSYTKSSDINSMTSLGISVNNDGTLSLNETSLNSVLNSDYSGVLGFFQNANSWGLSFSHILTNSGTSSTKGILALNLTSNSSIESKLNAQISKEDLLISAQQVSLTTELNTANQIMQAIPSELNAINELYSAITGYNKNS
jgi:flagellar hook-associated protein 2